MNLGSQREAGRYFTLCELVDRGQVHALWIVGSGDVPDASAAEVLQWKPIYDAAGNRIASGSELAWDRCAGNGCFDPDVPHCGGTLRIGFVSYTRGPGCFMHGEGHGMEIIGWRGNLPALATYMPTFAGFDLDRRYGLPFTDCCALPCATPPCIHHPNAARLEVDFAGDSLTREPFDPVCGNVHFSPNGEFHYDYANPNAVQSSCLGFGRVSRGPRG